jgi:LysM repeat protein
MLIRREGVVRRLNNYIITIATLLLLCCKAGTAQSFGIDSTLKERYPFINWERNRLDFYGESPAFERFFAKMDSAYNGRGRGVEIFHIGGSHIQADIYSHRIRRHLHGMNENMKGGRGFLFPYTIAETNNPWNYLIEYTGKWKGYRSSVLKAEGTCGLAGLSAETYDSLAEIRISNRTGLDYRYDYDAVKIFWNTSPEYCLEALEPELVERIEQNDSLQYTIFRLKRKVESFSFRLWRTGPENESSFLLMGMELMRKGGGVRYHSIGVNGSSFESYKRCTYFTTQLKQFRPDLFIVSIGTNDSYNPGFDTSVYRKNYENFMKTVWLVNPDCAILLTVPNDCYYNRRYANPNVALAAEVIKNLARKYKMAVWNFYEIMGGKGSSQKWYLNKLMPSDRIHFSGPGYDIKGDLFTSAFLQAWDVHSDRDSTFLFYKHIDPERKLSYHSPITRTWSPPAVLNTQNDYTEPTASGNYIYHTIKQGDTLWDVAVKYNTSVASLERMNPGVNARNLKIGQKLKIRSK